MILLDTAAWIWAAADKSRLSPPAETAIEAHDVALVSAISVWEFGMLVAKGLITLDRPVERWIGDALRLPGLEPAPIDHRIAALAAALPADPPSDPADRFIVATALVRGCPVVTPDRRLHDYRFCPTVW